jgi:hypothetical protein
MKKIMGITDVLGQQQKSQDVLNDNAKKLIQKLRDDG